MGLHADPHDGFLWGEVLGWCRDKARTGQQQGSAGCKALPALAVASSTPAPLLPGDFGINCFEKRR